MAEMLQPEGLVHISSGLPQVCFPTLLHDFYKAEVSEWVFLYFCRSQESLLYPNAMEGWQVLTDWALG